MEFRKAAEGDIDALVDRRMAMRAEREEGTCPLPADEFRARTRDYFSTHLREGNFIAWLAVEEGEIIATSGLCVHHVPPTYGNPSGKVAYLVNMYTIPEHRGQGIAARLLELLMDEARALGCGRVALNSSRAGRPLYDKYGFIEVPNEMEYFLE